MTQHDARRTISRNDETLSSPRRSATDVDVRDPLDASRSMDTRTRLNRVLTHRKQTRAFRPLTALLVWLLAVASCLGCANGGAQPADDDSTRIATFPKLAENPVAPASTLDELTYLLTHDGAVALAHDSGLTDTTAFARGVYRGYGVEVRKDAPTLRVTVEAMEANSTFRFRSFGYNETSWSWVNSTYNATSNTTTEMTIHETINDFITEGASYGWRRGALNGTGDATLPGAWWTAELGLVPISRYDVTTVEVEVTSGTKGSDTWANQTYQLLVTRNDVTYTCPGATSTTHGCIAAEYSNVSEVPSVLTQRQTASIVVEGYDANGRKRKVGGEAGGILAQIASGSDRQTATVTDLGTGNYVLNFAPGKAGTYDFGVKFWGDNSQFTQPFSHAQTFWVNPKRALPSDFFVTPDVNKFSLGSNSGVVIAGQICDFLVNSSVTLPSDFESSANVAADGQYFGANGISDSVWLSTMGYTNIHDFYVPPSPTSLEITRDVLKKERYFWFSETTAGRYTVRVLLGNDHLGQSPYSIRVAGGLSVNHVFSDAESVVAVRAGKGVASLPFAIDENSDGAPPDATDQLSEYTLAGSTFTSGTTLGIDFDLRDQYGNVAEVDHDDVDLLIKFTNKAVSRKGGEGEVVTANATRILESTVTGRGHRATATLPIAGTYSVTATLNGVTLCVATNSATATTCIPDVVVETGPADRATSLVLGTGAHYTRNANQSTTLTVVPVDSAGNAVSENGDHRYTVTIKCVVSHNAASVSVDDVLADSVAASYDTSTNDGPHFFSDLPVIQYSGVYEYSVTQSAPAGSAGSVKTYNVTVVPSPVDTIKWTSLTLNAASEAVLVGDDDSQTFGVYDSFGNLIYNDLSADMRVTMSPNVTNDKPRTFTSDADIKPLNFGPLRVTFLNGAYTLAYNLPVTGTYTVSGVTLDGTYVAADTTFTLIASAGNAIAATSTALGGATRFATAGVEQVFPVLVADRYGNVLAAAESGINVTVHAAITVGSSDASCETGKVTAIASSDSTASWNSDTKRYEAKYKSDVSGVLNIRIALSGGAAGFDSMGPVTGSPYFVNVAPAVTDAATSELVMTSTVETVDKVASFTIVAKDAFGNQKISGGDFFSVKVFDATGTVVSPAVSITDNGDGSYSCTWTPTTAIKTYEIRVLLGGFHVTGSPVTNVEAIAASSVASFDSSKSVAVGDGLSKAVAGVLSKFTIHANNLNSARLHSGGVTFVVSLTPSSGSAITFTGLTASDSGSDGSNLSPGEGIVVDKSDGTYVAMYIIETSGLYDLSVKSGSVSIHGTWPSSVTAYTGVTSAVKSTMQLGTDPHTFPSTSVTGATITTRITSLDSNGNTRCYSDDGDGRDGYVISVTRDGFAVSDTEVRLTKTQTKATAALDVALTPKQAGTYVVSVSLDGVSIVGSPATITVTSDAVDASTSGASFGGGALFGGRVGVERTATLTARDTNGNVVVSGLSDSTCDATLSPEFASTANATITCVLTAASEGLFTVTVKAYDAGSYTLEVKIGGVIAATRSGITFVPGRSHAASSTASGTGITSVESGASTTFTVSARDAFGNERTVGGDSVVARVPADSILNTPESYGTTVDNDDGTYTVTYVAPKAVGMFTFEVTLGGEPIDGSDFYVSSTRASTEGALSFVQNAETEIAGIAGELNSFTITPVNVHGAEQPLNDASTSGDVFDLTITPDGNSFGTFPNGSTAVAIQETDGGGFQVNWRADRVVHASDGTALNYTINVTFGGVHISGSPFAAPLLSSRADAANGVTFDASGSIVQHSSIRGTFPKQILAGTYQQFVFQTRDGFNNDAVYDQFNPNTLRVTMIATPDDDLDAENLPSPNVANRDVLDGSSKEISISVRNLLDGTFRLQFIPETAGIYDLWIEVDGVKVGPVADSLGNAIDITPMRLEIIPAALSPQHFLVFGAGVDYPAAVNEPNSMRIQTRDRFGNDRVDTGKLLTLERRIIKDEYSTINTRVTIAGYVFDTEVSVRVGELWEGSSRTYPALFTEMLYVDDAGVDVDVTGAVPGYSQQYTPGTYLLNFTFQQAGTTVTKIRLNQTIEVRQGSSNAIVNKNVTHVVGSVSLNSGTSTFELGSGRTAATRAVFSGYGTEDGAAARVDLPVIVTPLDAEGNTAIITDPSRLTLNVSPDSRAKIVNDGLFVGPADDGTFSALWRGVAPGAVTVSIMMDGNHLPGSPKEISMLINPLYMNINPLLSVAEGPALRGATAGAESEFTIRMLTDSGAGYPTSADYRWDGSSPCVAGGVALGFVNVTLDGIPLSPSNPSGQLIDNCDGTYSAIVTQFKSGYRTFYVSMGPDDENLNFVDGEIRGVGGFGANAGFYELLVYSGPTADADVFFTGIEEGSGNLVFYETPPTTYRIGETLRAFVYPKDAHGNFQDYKAWIEDGLKMTTTVNRLYELDFTLVPLVNESTTPHSIYYEASLTPTEAGSYEVFVTFRDTNYEVVEASVGRTALTLLASTASTQTSVASGAGVSYAKTGSESYFRVELRDKDGNYAGDGVYIDPVDALTLPNQHNYDNELNPIILEARLVPHGMEWKDSNVVADFFYDNYQGVYIGTYTATFPGRHTLEILLHGLPLTLPVSYLGTEVVVGDLNTETTIAKGPNLIGNDSVDTIHQIPAIAGQSVNVVVESRDVHGNALVTGGSSFVVLARAQSGTYDEKTVQPDSLQSAIVVTVPSTLDRTNGLYETAFVPTLSGTWLLTVTRGGVQVQGSPYSVTVVPGVTSAAHSLLVCGDHEYAPGTDSENCPLSVSGATVGSAAPFYVLAKDDYNNTVAMVRDLNGDAFYYSVVGGDEKMNVNKWELASAVTSSDPAGNGYHYGSFETNVVGTVNITVTLGPEVVDTRNVTVKAGGIYPANCVAVSDGVPSAVAGVTYQVALTTRDSLKNVLKIGGESLRLNVSKSGSEDDPVELTVTDQNDGTYTSTFSVTRTGTWSLTPFDDSLSGFAPTGFEVSASDRNLSQTSIRGVDTFVPGPFAAGVAGMFVLTFRDKYGNVRYNANGLTEGVLHLSVVTPSGTTTTVTPTTTYYDETYTVDISLRGSFVVEFTSNTAGTLVISFVDPHGESLVKTQTNRPWDAYVVPGDVDASATELFGAGTKNAASGVANAALVKFFDALGNEYFDAVDFDTSDIVLTFAATPGSEASAPNSSDLTAIAQSTKYHGAGIYTVYYTPPTSANANSYYLRVTAKVGGSEIVGSSQDVLVAPATSANVFKTAVLDSRLGEIDASSVVDGNRFVAGTAGSLTIEVRDDAGAATGAPSADYARVACTPSVGVTTSLALTSEGRIKRAITATSAGTYACHVEAGGPTAANYAAVSGNWASVSDASRGTVLIQVVPGDLLTAPDAGDVKFEALPGDFYGQVSTTPIVYASDTIDTAATELTTVAGVRSSVLVRSMDAYKNDAKYMTWFGPETYRSTLTGTTSTTTFYSSLTDIQDGSYELVFEATESGVFDLSATLGDVTIQKLAGETVTVAPGEVFPPLTTFVPGFHEDGPTPDTSPAGTAIEFTIQARDHFSNLHTVGDEFYTLTVTAPPGSTDVGFDDSSDAAVVTTGSDNKIIATKMIVSDGLSEDSTSGDYPCKFTPYTVGSYSVQVTHVGSGVNAMEKRTVVVTAGPPDASRLETSGSGAFGGVAGFTSNFLATAKDAFGNQLLRSSELHDALTFEVFESVNEDGDSPDVSGLTQNTGLLLASTEVVTNDDDTVAGSVSVTYVVESIGTFWLAPRVFGVLAHGAPFRLEIVKRPAPKLIGAVISNDLTHVSVTFDVDTNRGYDATAEGTSESKQSCVSYFDSDTVLAFGGNQTYASTNGVSPSNCAWRDDITLVVFFGSKATVLPGDLLVLKADATIKNKEDNSYVSSGSVEVNKPMDPTPPLASISAADVLGPCDGVTLDASASVGGGGRPLTYAFSVSADTTDGYEVIKALNDASRLATDNNQGASYPVVRLTSDDIHPGIVYQFSARVTDFVGNFATATVSVNKTMYPMPNSRVLGAGAGSTRYIRRADDVIIETEARLPSYQCSDLTQHDVGDSLTYRWQLIEGPVISDGDFPTELLRAQYLNTLDTKSLYIPRRTLTAGQTYRWRLRTSLATNPTRFYSDSFVQLETQSSPISVGLQSGSSRTVFNDSPVVLQLDPYDPDDAVDSSGVPYPFTVTWRCALEDNTECAGVQLPDAFLNGNTLVVFPPNSLTTDTYRFTVTVQKEPLQGAGRVVSEDMTVTVVSSPANVRKHSGSNAGLPVLTAYGPVSGEVSVTDRLSIRAAVKGCADGGFSFVDNSLPSTCLGVIWSVVAGDLNATTLAHKSTNGVGNDVLTLAANALTPGSSYTFRATATGAACTGLTSDVSVLTNSAPRGGRVVAEELSSEVSTAEEVQAMQYMGYRRYSVRALDFADSREDYPLRYAFFSKNASTNVLTPLSGTQSSNALEVLLKPSDENIYVKVYDNKNAVSASVFVAVDVQSAPPPSPPPPPSPLPPPYTGVGGGSRRRRVLLEKPLEVPQRTLLQLNEVSTDLDLAEAVGFVTNFLRPAVALSDHAFVTRVVSLYADRQVVGDEAGTAVTGTCAMDVLVTEHQEVISALRNTQTSTIRTKPGLEMSLCSASVLSSDPRKVSLESFETLVSVLKSDSVFAFGETDLSLLSETSLQCALTAVSNLIAVARSDCFVIDAETLAAFADDVVESITNAVQSFSRFELVPGAVDLNVRGVKFDTNYLSIASVAVDPSAAVGGGFPATVTIDGSTNGTNYASITLGGNASAIGEPFSDTFGDGHGVVTLTSFRGFGKSFFDAGFAPEHVWFHSADDRLASDITTLEVTHFSTTDSSATNGLVNSIQDANVTLWYDEAMKPNAYSRRATVRYFDEQIAYESATTEYEKAQEKQDLEDEILTYNQLLIVDPIVNGTIINGTFVEDVNGTLINATYPPPPGPSPPPPTAGMPPAPREGTGVTLGTGWIDDVIVAGSSTELEDSQKTFASFSKMPNPKVSFASFLTNAFAPPPPSPPPPPRPPPAPPPPVPPPALKGPEPKSYFLEIVLGSTFGSLLVLAAAIYVYVNRRVNGPDAANRYREYVKKRRDALKDKAALKEKIEKDKAADMWEQYKRERARLKVVDWARGKLGLNKGKKSRKVSHGERHVSRISPPRANEAGGGLIFGGRNAKVYPQ